MNSTKKKKKNLSKIIFSVILGIMLFALPITLPLIYVKADSESNYYYNTIFTDSYFASYYNNTLFPYSDYSVSFSNDYSDIKFDLQNGGYTLRNFNDNGTYSYISNNNSYKIQKSTRFGCAVGYPYDKSANTSAKVNTITYTFNNILIPFIYDNSDTSLENISRAFNNNLYLLEVAFDNVNPQVNFDFSIIYTTYRQKYEEGDNGWLEYNTVKTEYSGYSFNTESKQINLGDLFHNLSLSYLIFNDMSTLPTVFNLGDYCASDHLLSKYDSYYIIDSFTISFTILNSTDSIYLRNYLPSDAYSRYFFNKTLYQYLSSTSKQLEGYELYSEGYNDGYYNGYNDGADYGNPFAVIISGVDKIINFEFIPGFKISYLFMISVGVIVVGVGLKFVLGG